MSVIVDPHDANGVKKLLPNGGGAVSGCQTFPCNNVYKSPGDPQTLTSSAVGGSRLKARRDEAVGARSARVGVLFRG